MLILLFVLVFGAMAFYAFTQSRAPIDDGTPPLPRDPLLEARDNLQRQIEVLETSNRDRRGGISNPWSDNTLEILRAELAEVDRRLGQGAAS